MTTQMPRSDYFVSVIAPLENHAGIVKSFVEHVLGILRAHYTNYELLLIDDGSTDRTRQEVVALLEDHQCVRYLHLSRRFGTEVALSAGLDTAIGDYVVVMLPQMDPPELIPTIVEKARSGPSVVYGILESRAGQPWWLKLGASVFFWVSNKILRLNVPRDSTYFRALSRQAVNALNRTAANHRYVSLMSMQVGFPSESFHFRPVSRGRSKTFREAVELAIGIVRSNSINPLRLVAWLGLAASLANALYAVAQALRNDEPSGFAVQGSIMFFLVFLILAVLCEYVGVLLVEAKKGPRYHLSEELNSAVMVADQDRRNVVAVSSEGQSERAGT